MYLSMPIQPEDWFTVTLTEAHETGLSKRFVKNTRQLVDWLQEKYPEQQWDKMFTIQGRFGQQRRLEQAVKKLFPVRDPSLVIFGLNTRIRELR